MKDFLANTGGSSSVKLSNLDSENLAIWTTEKVNKLLDDIEDGVMDVKSLKHSPFKDNEPAWKKANLIFEYTPDEVEEIRRCKSDVLYFANAYAQVMTEDGIQQIVLRDYQEEILYAFDKNRFSILDASRQIGKSVMAAIYIAWTLIFQTDKNVLTVANIATTTKEVMDKIKSILENLPFFLKPGCVSNNVMSMRFDNGCRLIGRTTTKNTGIGFAIHLLYIDEFAHINPSYLNFFYRAIYPTISASTQSKIIITSTPNGMNKFYEIYMDALEGKNNYTPLRVDWWQVPGRDDQWKKDTIADLGSEEDFNQEYGLQFFSSDVLLLPSKTLKKIFNLRIEYEVPDWVQMPGIYELLDGLSFHPKMAKMSLADIQNDPSFYIFSVDTADGLNRDYSVINIFKFVALPDSILESVKDFIKVETDIFSLVQVGTFRTNTKDINEYCNALDFLMFDVFNPEKVRLLVELNHKGEYIMDKITKNQKYWQGMMVLSKHTEASQYWKPGLRLTTTNKIKYCERFKFLAAINKVLPNEFRTVHELGSFGRAKNGTYRSQSGHDDLAMSCVNASAFFDSPNFWEIANEEIDRISKKRLAMIHEKYLSDIYFNGKSTKYDYNILNELNTSGIARKSGLNLNLTEDYVTSHRELIEKFYGRGDLEELQRYKEEMEKFRNS